MGGVTGQVGGQVDDVKGVHGALLDTDTAPNAQLFGDPYHLGGWGHVHALLPAAYNGAVALAFLPPETGVEGMREQSLYSLLKGCTSNRHLQDAVSFASTCRTFFSTVSGDSGHHDSVCTPRFQW